MDEKPRDVDGLPDGWPEMYSAAERSGQCPHQMHWDDADEIYRCIYECGEVDHEPPESKIVATDGGRPSNDTARSGMIWTDPRELMSSDYHVHPIYHSDASYKPVWHSVQGASERRNSMRIDADTLRCAAAEISQNPTDTDDADLRTDGGERLGDGVEQQADSVEGSDR